MNGSPFAIALNGGTYFCIDSVLHQSYSPFPWINPTARQSEVVASGSRHQGRTVASSQLLLLNISAVPLCWRMQKLH